MEPFLGQIKIWSFPFNPKGYAFCNGATMNMQQNAALYSLLYTQFGGNGSTTFLLPDLRSRVPLGANPTQNAYLQGRIGGAEMVMLDQNTMPAHFHAMNASTTPASFPVPGTSNRLAQAHDWPSGGLANVYGLNSSPVALAADSIGNTGGGQPHPNLQPYQVLNFCIALTGYYPSRS